MKNDKKYISPTVEAIELPDDIITESKIFGEEADDTVIWPSN